MISKKNRKNGETVFARAEYEAIFPRYVFQQSQLSNSKSIDLLRTRVPIDKAKGPIDSAIESEKENILRRPSYSNRKQSKTKRKSIKLKNNNSRHSPRKVRDSSDGKLTILPQRRHNSHHNMQQMNSKTMLAYVYTKCSGLLADYRRKIDLLEMENRKYLRENKQLVSRLSKYEGLASETLPIKFDSTQF